MHRVGYRAVKSTLRVEKSKIAHYFFFDQNFRSNNYIFKKPMKNVCKNMCQISVSAPGPVYRLLCGVVALHCKKC